MILKGKGRRDYTLNPTTRGPTNGVQFNHLARVALPLAAVEVQRERDGVGELFEGGRSEAIVRGEGKGSARATLYLTWRKPAFFGEDPPAFATIDLNEESLLIGDMTQFPVLHYPKKEIVRAGKALKERMPYVPEHSEILANYLHVFRVAYDWRNSHAFPMRKIRYELGGRVRRLGGFTAGRIKRMSSIRKKLRKTTNTLTQIQDLAGCRAILPTMTNAIDIVQYYLRGKSPHNLVSYSDYLSGPKIDGYRSFHIVLSFNGSCDDESIYDGRRIEIQIRTQLQHVWATAVEAVGLMRGEDLKGSEGSREWLRLFQLMSSEFAVMEGFPLCPGVPSDKSKRLSELRSVAQSINAVDNLVKMNGALDVLDSTVSERSKYYLVQFDSTKQRVNIKGYSNPISGTEKSSKEEQEHVTLNTVLVEVDRFENLRAAYPNYYMDVDEFTSNLKWVLGGRNLPDGDGRWASYRPLDLSWIHDWTRRKRRGG